MTESVRLFNPDRMRVRVANVRAAQQANAHAATSSFRTADGFTIPVAYTPNPSVEQSYVNFLGSLVHGGELGKLSVYIATPSQIEKDFCGQGALACYVGDEERTYVPGVSEQSDPPVQFLIAHEYGHHIELTARTPRGPPSTSAPSAGPAMRTCARSSAGAGSRRTTTATPARPSPSPTPSPTPTCSSRESTSSTPTS